MTISQRPVYYSACVVMVVAATSTHSARADGLIYQLPKDGAWVTFQSTEVMINGKDVSGNEILLTISSVGEATVDDEKCRWIEIKYLAPNEEPHDPIIYKLLIPEKHLGKGKAAAEHVIRGWGHYGRKGTHELKNAMEVRQGIMAFNQSVLDFLSGPPKDAKDLPKVEVDCKLGRLSCAGVSGAYKLDLGGVAADVSFENRLHDKARFGVVTSAWKTKSKFADIAGDVVVSYKLTGAGGNAVSELPDKE